MSNYNAKHYSFSFLQKIPFSVYANNQFVDNTQITIYVGNRYWPITLDGMHFANGWETFCAANLIQKTDFILFRSRENFTFDAITFAETQGQIMMPFTYPLPMLQNYEIIQQGNYISNKNILHTCKYKLYLTYFLYYI